MAGVLLEPKAKTPAREIVIVPRLPDRPKTYGLSPWSTDADVTADCDGTINGKPCGWHAMGPRAQVKKAYDEHRRMFHSDDIGVVLLNQPRQ